MRTDAINEATEARSETNKAIEAATRTKPHMDERETVEAPNIC